MTLRGGPYGECILTREPGPDGEVVTIVRADPRIRICFRGLSFRTGLAAKVVDNVLTIRGANRTVVYRIDRSDYDAATGTFHAEWPD